MQKKLLILFAILCLVIIPRVNAACSYKEKADLNKEVATIKVGYEIITEKAVANDADMTEKVEYTRELFKVNLLNLSDHFYAVVSNNIDNKRNTYRFSDAVSGVISYKWAKLEKVSTHTFNIYASSKTGCADELYRTIYLTLPRYNSYHDWAICTDRDNVSLCNKYVTTEETSYSSFIDSLTKATNTGNNASTNNTSNNTQESKDSMVNISFIAGCVIGVSAVVLAFTLFRKKRNQL